MADRVYRRPRLAPERLNYRQSLEWVENFVDNELGNGRVPRPRPDDSSWRTQRVKTIQKLKELKQKLDKVCVGANYGKAVGNGAGFFGAAAAIIGAILSLKGHPSSSIFTDSGNLVHHTGNLINGVSNMVESLVSVKYLNEIEAVLKEDQELSRPLAEWLNISRELDANITEIFGVSLASKKWETVIKVCYEFSSIFSSKRGFDATLKLMRQGKFSVYIDKDDMLDILQKFSKHLMAFPQSTDKMRFILSVLSQSIAAIQVFRLGVDIYHSLKGIPGSSVVPSLQGGLNPDIPTATEVSYFCVFNTINIAINVISFINAKNIIRDGKSQYSDAIEQLINSLDSELKQMMDL